MKVIMLGPNNGHNIDPFIHLLRSSSNVYDCTYITKGKPNWSSTNRLPVISYEDSFSSEIKEMLKSEPSFIWVHAGYDIKQLLGVLWYKHKKSIVSLNIWGDSVPKMVQQKNLKSLVYRYVFSKMSQIHCNWYGTYRLLKDYKDKCIVAPWGLSKNFFSQSEGQVSGFTKDFVKSLPNNKVKFFYPKSILPVSGQIELIKAAAQLSKENDNFVIYLWVGNSNDKKMIETCKKIILNENISDNVKIVHHPFLPFHDIKYIWEHMDFGLQLAKSDQLSTTFLEPQLLRKPFVCTSIYPYTKYEEKYNIDLDLIELNIESIFKRLKSMVMKSYKVEEKQLAKRCEVIVSDFIFEKNIIDYLSAMKLKYFTD